MAENEYAPRKTGIAGVELQALKVIDAPGGAVLRMLRGDSPLLAGMSPGFGEIYFSEVLPGSVKAWKLHKKQNQLFAVPIGLIRIVLYDARADSPSMGTLVELALGRPDNYNLLRIPAGVWQGFQNAGNGLALICNRADMAHDPAECLRLDPDDPSIPYQWKIARAK